MTTSDKRSPAALAAAVLALAAGLLLPTASAAIGLPTITFGVEDANTPEQVSTALQVLLAQ